MTWIPQREAPVGSDLPVSEQPMELGWGGVGEDKLIVCNYVEQMVG